MVKRTANGICTIPTAATSCQSACKNYSKALFEIHSRKLTWIPKWWFGKGNFLYKWQFLVSMLDFWGVLTSFAFKEWTGTLWFCRGCLIWMMLFHNSEISEKSWGVAAPPVAILCSKDCWTIRLSDLDLWGWLPWHIPYYKLKGGCDRWFWPFFFLERCWTQPFPQKDKCNLQKKKSAFMHVVIWYICMCYIYTDLYTHTVHI